MLLAVLNTWYTSYILYCTYILVGAACCSLLSLLVAAAAAASSSFLLLMPAAGCWWATIIMLSSHHHRQQQRTSCTRTAVRTHDDVRTTYDGLYDVRSILVYQVYQVYGIVAKRKERCIYFYFRPSTSLGIVNEVRHLIVYLVLLTSTEQLCCF